MSLSDPTAGHCYITTQSGLRLALPDLQVQDVQLADIVHSLSLQCRFMGHVRRFYSVAEHCVMVCALAEREHGYGSAQARCALLHDAAEAYVGDHPSPLKKRVPALKEMEHGVEAVVLEALRLPGPQDPVWQQVKQYDLYALHVEAASLFTPPPPWVRPVEEAFHHPIHCLLPDQAKDRMAQKLVEYGYRI